MSEKVVECELGLLAGIIPSSDQVPKEVSFRNLEHLISRVKVELFSKQAQILVGLCVVCRQDGATLTEDLLVDWLQRKEVKAEQIVQIQMLFDRARHTEISEGKFRYMTTLFLQEREVDLFKIRLNEAFTIVDTGMKVGKSEMKGIGAAKEYLMSSMFRMDQMFLLDAPQGNVRADAKEVWDEYVSRRDFPKTHEGVLTGFKVVDDLTNGAFPGELWLIAAFTGQGKTNTLINWIYNAAVYHGKNVAVAVNEMLYRQYRIRLFIRHTRHEKFKLPNGIPYNHYKRGTIDPSVEAAFREVILDFEQNPAYGRIEVFQIPKDAGMDFISSRFTALQSSFRLDVGFIDYLQLVGSASKYQSDREYLNNLLIDTKKIATSFDRGRGIPIITPWQINRDSYKKALESKDYNLSCLAEASQAERSSDFVMWLLRDDKDLDKHEITAGVIKYRDGIISNSFRLFEDFETYYLGNMREDQGSPVSPLIDADGESLL